MTVSWRERIEALKTSVYSKILLGKRLPVEGIATLKSPRNKTLAWELTHLRTARAASRTTAAALAGIVVLGELLGPPQYAAIACVVAASVGATRSGQQAVLRD